MEQERKMLTTPTKIRPEIDFTQSCENSRLSAYDLERIRELTNQRKLKISMVMSKTELIAEEADSSCFSTPMSFKI
jgi:hypothetical protein